MTHEQIVALAKENHYVNNLISVKEMWKPTSGIGVVLEDGSTKQCRTVADLHSIGLCSERFLVIDEHIGNLLNLSQQMGAERGRFSGGSR